MAEMNGDEGELQGDWDERESSLVTKMNGDWGRDEGDYMMNGEEKGGGQMRDGERQGSCER